MAGIYLHIPFCKKKCSYCDFYSNTNLEIASNLIEAVAEELRLRKDYLKKGQVDSIYFGGGTPSVIKLEPIELLLNAIHENYQVGADCEITFECNPDDLTDSYLSGLKQLGINRLSIGVQSFNDETLKFLGRRHSAEQAYKVIIKAIQEGFGNVSIDLIFGIPGMAFDNYKNTLRKGIDAGVQHISAYQLTFEENTLLYKKLKNNIIQEIDEEGSLEQFDYTMTNLSNAGFHQYEVSNYAREGFMSKHNWLYWNNGIYLGVGPSAHSFDGQTRQWNISDNRDYIKGITLKEGYFRSERLEKTDKYHEYILTSLRTSKGVSEDYVLNNFGTVIYEHFNKIINELFDDQFVCFNNGSYVLSKKGIFILDLLIGKLYYN